MLIDANPLPGYPEPYGLLCAILQDGTSEWRLELDPRLTEDALVWQAHPGMHSIGATILHMIGAEVFWFEQFALGLPAFPVDTHVYRVTGRLGLRAEKLSLAAAHEHLAQLFAPEAYASAHLNLIRLGREVCRARTPDCPRCPVRGLCPYYRRLKTTVRKP